MKDKIIKGTTPTVEIAVDKLEDNSYKCFLSFGKFHRPYVTIEMSKIEETEKHTIFSFELTQEDTLKLPNGTVDMQMRGVNEEGTAIATECFPIEVIDSIQDGVISYDEENV